MADQTGDTLRLAISVTAVLSIMAATLWRAFGGPSTLALILAGAIILLIVSQYRQIPRHLRNTSLLLFAVSALLLPFAKSPIAAFQRGIFVSGLLLALMASVMLLARCALRSKQVQTVGQALRSQCSGRRYIAFNLASQLFSATLSMAGTNIMLVMASPNDGKTDETASIVAITRGFTAAAFWSPMFGNMAILLALYPALQWIDVFPLTALVAQTTVLVGFLMHRRSSQAPESVSGNASQPQLKMAAVALVVATLAFLGTILVISQTLEISITASIVLLGPISAILFNVVLCNARHRVRDALRQVAEDARQFPRLSSEALLFAAAGCAGAIMAEAFPASWIQWIGATFGKTPFLGIAFLMFSIIALALAGIHPVLSAVFMASTITPQVLALPAFVHCSAILIGWGLSASLTPYSVLVLTASRYSNAKPYQLSLQKNWRFAILNFFIACLALTIAASVLR